MEVGGDEGEAISHAHTIPFARMVLNTSCFGKKQLGFEIFKEIGEANATLTIIAAKADWTNLKAFFATYKVSWEK